MRQNCPHSSILGMTDVKSMEDAVLGPQADMVLRNECNIVMRTLVCKWDEIYFGCAMAADASCLSGSCVVWRS